VIVKISSESVLFQIPARFILIYLTDYVGYSLFFLFLLPIILLPVFSAINKISRRRLKIGCFIAYFSLLGVLVLPGVDLLSKYLTKHGYARERLWSRITYKDDKSCLALVMWMGSRNIVLRCTSHSAYFVVVAPQQQLLVQYSVTGD
jgi:hypothetical protein